MECNKKEKTLMESGVCKKLSLLCNRCTIDGEKCKMIKNGI